MSSEVEMSLMQQVGHLKSDYRSEKNPVKSPKSTFFTNISATG